MVNSVSIEWTWFWINESDMYLYPDLDTWTVFPVGRWKWQCSRLDLWCLYDRTCSFAGDPRSNLKRAQTYGSTGSSLSILVLSQNFPFKWMKIKILTLEVNKGGYFDFLSLTDLADNICREIVNVLTKMGFEVEAVKFMRYSRSARDWTLAWWSASCLW